MDDLDRMLARGDVGTPAPATIAEAAGLARAVVRRRTRRFRGLATGGTAIALLVGGTGFAAAYGGFIPFIDWKPDNELARVVTLDDGSQFTCPIAFRAQMQYSKGATPDQMRAAIAEAEKYLQETDLSQIKVNPEILRLPWHETSGTDADVAMSAWTQSVARSVYDHLESVGLPPAVGVEAANAPCRRIE